MTLALDISRMYDCHRVVAIRDLWRFLSRRRRDGRSVVLMGSWALVVGSYAPGRRFGSFDPRRHLPCRAANDSEAQR